MESDIPSLEPAVVVAMSSRRHHCPGSDRIAMSSGWQAPRCCRRCWPRGAGRRLGRPCGLPPLRAAPGLEIWLRLDMDPIAPLPIGIAGVLVPCMDRLSSPTGGYDCLPHHTAEMRAWQVMETGQAGGCFSLILDPFFSPTVAGSRSAGMDI